MIKKSGVIIIEGHVQGLSNTRSLGEMGIPVYVVDKSNCIARYSKYCQKFFICPDFIKEEFVEFLINLAINENIKDWLLIPSNDHAVFSISKNKERLLKYYKIVTPNIRILDKMYDKLRLLNIAIEHDVPIPVTFKFRSSKDCINDNIKYPVLTKGRNGLTFFKIFRKKVILSSNIDELKSNLKFIEKYLSIKDTFTQELIPFDGKNKTISFTAFCVSGEIKTYWMGIKIREHPIRFGTATLAESIYNNECYIQSIKLLKALDYTGICEVEYLLDPRDSKYKLIEINARTWLWVGLAKVCGIDYAKILYCYANNISYRYNENYKLNVKWFNIFTDLLISLKLFFKKQILLSQYLKSMKGKKVEAIFDKHDPLPFFILIVLIFYIAKKRIF
ncbi:MAG: hypothetical protein WCL51_05010 [Bacteroidota bacterium]